jgi:hypothetical protein
MSPTLAVVLLVVALAIVGVLGLRFMAGETRRFHEEHDELQCRHREMQERVDRALEATPTQRLPVRSSRHGSGIECGSTYRGRIISAIGSRLASSL